MTATRSDDLELCFAPAAERIRRVLNVGSGPKSARKLQAVFDSESWREVRLDLDPSVEPDVLGSMTELGAQFAPRSFDAIWSCHSLEHLHTHEIATTLTGFQRILKSDGFALISCPDLETVMTLFLENGSDHVVYQSAAGPITPIDMMFGHSTSIASGKLHMAHNTGFTSTLLGEQLLKAGFATAITRRRNFDLWALALMEGADQVAIQRKLHASGLDMSDSPK
jgi:predicted SAM-dependent methyltransferase